MSQPVTTKRVKETFASKSANWVRSIFKGKKSSDESKPKSLVTRRKITPPKTKLNEYLDSKPENQLSLSGTRSLAILKKSGNDTVTIKTSPTVGGGVRDQQEIVKETTMAELKITLARRKSEIDSAEENSKNIIRTSTTVSTSGNVNHVWPIPIIYNEMKQISGFYKSGRNGNIQSAYKETLVYDIAVQFGMEKHFAATKIVGLSPRSFGNLHISSPRFLKRSSKSNSSPRIGSKEEAKKERRKSIGEFVDGDNLELSFQKGIQGKELHHIYEAGFSLFEWYSNKYYEDVSPAVTYKSYRRKFIKGLIISMMFGFWDGHSKNIILNGTGFKYFDNARSFPHSNNLIIRGDTIRLPYFTKFLDEDEFHEPMSTDDIVYLNRLCVKFENNLRTFEAYFYSSTTKKNLKIITKSWFNRKLVIESTRQRIEKLRSWINEFNKDEGGEGIDAHNSSFVELLYNLFPYYKYVTALTTATILKRLSIMPEEPEYVWRLALSRAGECSDILELTNKCLMRGVDPNRIMLLLNSNPGISPTEIIKEMISNKNNSIGRVLSVNAELCHVARTDFTECCNIPDLVASFLLQYAEIQGLNIFDLNNTKLSPLCVELGFVKSVEEILFGDGYFLSIYTCDGGGDADTGKEVLCTICYVNSKGYINIDDHKVKYDGQILIHFGKKWEPISYLPTIIEKHKKLFQSIKTLAQEEISQFTAQYKTYYEESYIAHVVDHTKLVTLNPSEFENTAEGYEQFELLKESFLTEHSYYITTNRLYVKNNKIPQFLPPTLEKYGVVFINTSNKNIFTLSVV